MNSTAHTIRCHARRLLRDTKAVALVEFAYSLPLLLILGLGGVELANYAVTHMRVSQLAVSLADNSSRFKEEFNGSTPVIREYDVAQAFMGADKQAVGLDFQANGRMIISSLEVKPSNNRQWIHWQRCWGNAPFSSSYGTQGQEVTGMGPTGRRIQSEEGYAIMFAEVVYNYRPLAFGAMIPDAPIRKIAAMYVRDDRDLASGLRASSGITPATCN